MNVRHGSGTFVANPPPVLEIAVDAATQVVDEGSVHASIKSVSHNVTESVLGHERDPDPVAARHLGMDAQRPRRISAVTTARPT